MPTAEERDSLAYVPITGAGVDALDRRKEHNNAEQVTAKKLAASIDKVKAGLFSGFKSLTIAAAKHAAR